MREARTDSAGEGALSLPLTFAIDLDGVCYEWSKTVRYMMREYRGYDREGPMGTESTSWNYIQAHVTNDDWKWLWSEGVRLGLFRYGHMIRGARRGLEALEGMGHSLVIASHRPKQAVNDTIDWISLFFKDIHITGVHVLTNEESKSSVDADVLVDDKLENVRDWGAGGRKALLFDQPWNRAAYLGGTNIERVYGWEGVVEWAQNTTQQNRKS